jgi:hypothetical protein
MQSGVRRVTHHPAIVRDWGNVENLSRPQLQNATIIESGRRDTAQYIPKMLQRTASLSELRADVL